MGKRTFLILLLITFLFASRHYIIAESSKLTADEKAKIILIVNSYYESMMNRDYKGALELVSLTETEYDNATRALDNSRSYKIEECLEGNNWVIPCNGSYDYVSYDKQSKCFIVQTSANIIYKSNTYQATENVCVKRVGQDFKIVRIITDDRFSYIRGSFAKRK